MKYIDNSLLERTVVRVDPASRCVGGCQQKIKADEHINKASCRCLDTWHAG